METSDDPLLEEKIRISESEVAAENRGLPLQQQSTAAIQNTSANTSKFQPAIYLVYSKSMPFQIKVKF
jgi:hypothetical protein